MTYIKDYSYNIYNFGTGKIKSDRNMLHGNYKIYQKNNYNKIFLIMFGSIFIDAYNKNAEIDKNINIDEIINNNNTAILDNFIGQIMNNYPNSVESLNNDLELLKNAKDLGDNKILNDVYTKILTSIKKLTNQSFTLKPL